MSNNLPKNIVIVEDEVITQRYMKDIFGHFGINIVGYFDNADDTLKAMPNIECDMILMDININGSVDGIQLARKILEKRDIPIIFITAHNDDATLNEVLDIAPYGFVSKPFSSKELIATLQVAYKRYMIQKNKNETTIETVKEKYVHISPRYKYSLELEELYDDGVTIRLNAKQTKLVKALVKRADHIVEYQVLSFAIWEESASSDSSLRTLVYSVRKLIPELPIFSHSKLGYSIKKMKEN